MTIWNKIIFKLWAVICLRDATRTVFLTLQQTDRILMGPTVVLFLWSSRHISCLQMTLENSQQVNLKKGRHISLQARTHKYFFQHQIMFGINSEKICHIITKCILFFISLLSRM